MATDSENDQIVDERDPLINSFLKYRRGEFNPKLDRALEKKGKKVLEKYNPKNVKHYKINTHSIFWMVLSMAVFYYTDFYMAVRMDPRVNWFWLCLGGAFLLSTLTIAFFCIAWFHYLLGITDYEKKFPYLVPMATAFFFLGMFCCCVALWSLWTWFTPFILFTFFMGIVFATSILPI